VPPLEFRVLGKVVPRSDVGDFDPVTLRLRREGVPQFLNPLDQRALRIALDLRSANEPVRLLSLGPPAVAPILAESYALGVDRIDLLSDPAFAGSDTLATSRLIARGVGGSPPSTILVTGARSTDSETGQVPAQIAEILGWPLFSEAREIRRRSGEDRFEITVDSPPGWTRYRATPPFVVSVGEKVAPLRKAAPEAIDAARQRPVPIRSATALGVDPATVGAHGSPTRVRWWRPDAPHRSPVVLAEGPLEERIGRAAAIVRSRWERPDAESSAPTPPTVGLTGPMAVLITDEEGRLDPEALAALSGLRSRAPRVEIRALWVGSPPSAEDTERIAQAGADRADLWPVPGTLWSTAGVAEALEGLFRYGTPFLAGLFVSHAFGRAVAGRLAVRLGCGLTGDAVGLADEEGAPVWIKPASGGAASAGIGALGLPHLATLRPGAFDGPPRRAASGRFEWSIHSPLPSEARFERVAVDRTPDPSLAQLRRAEIVVVVGRGSGGPERWALIDPILKRWGAAWGATRKVVDAEHLPTGRQIGLTGVSIAPRLAVLLGVGGSTNHLIGLRRAGTLLAVNSDPAAPVFAGVDVGIVAPLEEALPLLARGFAFLERPARPPGP